MEDQKGLKPLVDVILPTFQRKAMLNRAIASVFQQSFKAFKLWVVVDGEEAGFSSEILTPWQKKFREKTLKNRRFGPLPQMEIIYLPQNRGVSAARNTGIQKGSSPYVAFLDSDDEWKPDKLKLQVAALRQKNSRPLIHSNEIWIRRGKFLNQKKRHKKEGGRIFKACLSLCLISPSSVMMKRWVFKKVGMFREDFLVCEDYEMWLRICARWKVGFLAQALVVKYGGHKDQLSSRYHAMDRFRVLALNNFFKNPFINKAERKEVARVFKKKCEILIQGYHKHGHRGEAKKIQQMYRKTLSENKNLFQQVE